jgi:general secretion pathway protein M
MQQVKDWFYALQPRERWLITGGGILVVLVAIIVGLAPLYKAVSSRAERVAKKETDLAWMRSVAGEVLALGATSPMRPTQSAESLVVVVDRNARECGLSSALTGQTPTGDSGIRVRLESAEFDKLMVCLGNLQQMYAVSIESATIDRAGKPGLVNASLVLNRAGG